MYVMLFGTKNCIDLSFIIPLTTHFVNLMIQISLNKKLQILWALGLSDGFCGKLSNFLLRKQILRNNYQYFQDVNITSYPPQSKLAIMIPMLKISEKVNTLLQYCKYCTCTTTMHPNTGLH